ncbi:MAG: hypothetical protein GX798_01995 [Bacteroidales bacterium]|jgi:hypothetical protein|nr:hypothetical protein [Bacteroidales bacterium]
MKRILLYFIIVVAPANCLGQNRSTTLTLQQVEFKDIALTETLSDLSKAEQRCFSKNDFYVLDFFQSSLSGDEYYVTIDEFRTESNIQDLSSYFVVINDITFFISNKVALDIFEVLPTSKEFVFKQNQIPAVGGGDYHFLIWKTPNGYYHILLRTCGE